MLVKELKQIREKAEIPGFERSQDEQERHRVKQYSSLYRACKVDIVKEFLTKMQQWNMPVVRMGEEHRLFALQVPVYRVTMIEGAVILVKRDNVFVLPINTVVEVYEALASMYYVYERMGEKQFREHYEMIVAKVKIKRIDGELSDTGLVPLSYEGAQFYYQVQNGEVSFVRKMRELRTIAVFQSGAMIYVVAYENYAEISYTELCDTVAEALELDDVVLDHTLLSPDEMWVMGEVEPVEGVDYVELLKCEEPERTSKLVSKVEVKKELYMLDECYRAEIRTDKVRVSPARVSESPEAALRRMLAYVADMVGIFPEKWLHKWYPQWARSQVGLLAWQTQCVGNYEKLFWRTIHLGDGAKISGWYEQEVKAQKAAMYEALLEAGIRLKYDRLGIVAVAGPPARVDVTWDSVYKDILVWVAQYTVDCRIIGQYTWASVVRRVSARYAAPWAYDLERRYVESLSKIYDEQAYEKSIGVLALEGAVEAIDTIAVAMMRYQENVRTDQIRRYMFRPIQVNLPRVFFVSVREGDESMAHPVHNLKCVSSIIMEYREFRRKNGWDDEEIADFRELCRLVARDAAWYSVDHTPRARYGDDEIEEPAGDIVLLMMGLMVLSKTMRDVLKCWRTGVILLSRQEVELLGVGALQQCQAE